MQLYQRTGGKDPIFANQRKGRPVLGARHWFEDAIKKAGIQDFTWHDCRYTFASRLAVADVPIRKIADLMGHATIQMTMKYAHLSRSSKLDAVRKLGAFGGADKVTILRTPTGARTEVGEKRRIGK